MTPLKLYVTIHFINAGQEQLSYPTRFSGTVTHLQYEGTKFNKYRKDVFHITHSTLALTEFNQSKQWHSFSENLDNIYFFLQFQHHFTLRFDLLTLAFGIIMNSAFTY